MRRGSRSFFAASCRTTQLPHSSLFTATSTSRIIRTNTISVNLHSKSVYSSFSHVIRGCSAHSRGSANRLVSTLPSASSKRQTVAVVRASTNIRNVKDYSSFFSRGKSSSKLPFSSCPHRVLIAPPPTHKCHLLMIQKNLESFGGSSGSYLGTQSRFYSLADSLDYRELVWHTTTIFKM